MLLKRKDYRLFVQNLILQNTKDNFFFYKKLKINLKPIQYRLVYVSLLNDPDFFHFYNNLDKKKNFNFSSIISYKYATLVKKKNLIIKLNFNLRLIFNYIKNNELFYNLHFVLINFFFSQKKNKKFFLCFVHKKKLFYHIYFLLKKIRYKCIFIVLSKKQQKELRLDDSNSIVLPPINLSETSFFFNQNANINFYIKSVYKIFENFSPKFILSVEGDHFFSEILSQVGRAFDVKSVCLQWGAFPLSKPKLSFRNMSHDYFISWGKFFTKQLQPYNKKVKFLDFGYFFSKKKKFKANKVVFFLQPYDFSFTKNSFLELCELAFRLARKFPDWNFVIREHPDFTFEDLYSKNFKLNIKNIILEKYIKKNLSESLSESKISVGVSSSALIESLFFDTIPCVLQLNKNMKFVPNFKKLKIGFVESNSVSMEYKISNLIRNKNFLHKMQKNIIMKKVIFFQNTKKKSLRLISIFLNNKLI
jgi:hypothetical protein